MTTPPDAPEQALDKFGQFMVAKLRDRAIEKYLLTQDGYWLSPGLQSIQKGLGKLSSEQRQLVLEVVVDVLDTALHDVLFAFQEAHDCDDGIAVMVDGINVAAVSDGMNGELYSDEGWLARFSRYPDLGRN